MVSQFGELGGLVDLAGAAPVRGACRTSSAKSSSQHRRQPVHHRRPTRRSAATSSTASPEPHARRDGQPGLRAGRGRSRGAQPDGVRVVLRRAPAVLRRRARPVPLRRELQQRQLQQRGAVLQPAHRPHAAAGRHVRRHGAAAADDDPRRRQAARALSGRAHSSACSTPSRSARRAPGDTTYEPATNYAVAARAAGFAQRQQHRRRRCSRR